jgi:hypothetical protein
MAFVTPVDGFIPATGGSNPDFYNAALNAPIDATVPQMIEETSAIVTEALALNQGFAQDALAAAKTTMTALSTASFPPALPSPPPAPSIITTFGSALTPGFEDAPDFGSIDTSQVETFALAAISIPTIDADIPDYVPIITGLQLPDAPAYVAPDSPVEPGIDLTIDLPTAPAANYGAVPDLDEIVMPVYAQPELPLFNDDAPTFNVLPPSPFIDWQEPVYASEVKDAVAGVIQEMLAGGTGIAEDDERAHLRARPRARGGRGLGKAIDAAINQWAARGFAHPTGAAQRADPRHSRGVGTQDQRAVARGLARAGQARAAEPAVRGRARDLLRAGLRGRVPGGRRSQLPDREVRRRDPDPDLQHGR